MNEQHVHVADHLDRSINWKQGLAIALGVPLLILPSLGYIPLYLGAAAILIWGLSVLQGFIQNTAFAELTTTFPEASGLPGCAQRVFSTEGYQGKYDKGKLIGGFSAWTYWFGWAPVMALFGILVGSYLHQLFPVLAQTFSERQLSVMAGVVMFGGLFLVNWFGLKDGAILSYILAAISLIPLAILAVAPFATGHVEMSNITGSWLPTDWAWDPHHILILLGIFAIAEYSACAWETAAIYGPEYENPGKDLPKALYSCGIICFVAYVLVQAAVIGVLGVDGVIAEPLSPLIPVAHAVFGQVGTTIAIIMLIAAMVLITQTAYLGASRAMYSMASEGDLPHALGHTNSHGTPFVAMLVTAAFNLVLIYQGSLTVVLSAAAIGYTTAQGMGLFTYVKSKRHPSFANLERPFKAPKGWTHVATVFGVLNVPLFLIGLVYLNSLEVGWIATWVGFGVLAAYIPIWLYSQHESRRLAARLETSGVSQT